MSELEKCRRLAVWLRSIELALGWVYLHRHVRRAKAGADELPNIETALGHALLTIIGEWPLESTALWDETDRTHRKAHRDLFARLALAGFRRDEGA